MRIFRPIVSLLLSVVIVGTPQPAAAATITFTSGPPPASVVAYEAYPTHTFTATGDTTINFTLAAGSIPFGMALSSVTGKLSGTPTKPGTSTFTVRAVGLPSGDFADQDVTIAVIAPTITITSGTPTSPWFTNQPYPTHTFTATGGQAPHSVTLRSGSLPFGMALSSVTGNLSGTPTVVGTNTFGVRVLDANGFFADQEVTVVIADPAAAITSGAPPKGTVGKPYSFTFTAGGDSNIAFSVSAATPPPGLRLAPGGVLSGTPTTEGSFGFTVKATGTATSAEQDFTLVIEPAPASPSPRPSGSASASPSASASADPSASTGASASASGNGGLPRTGQSTPILLLVAGLAIALGAVLLVVARRARRLRASE